MKVKLSFGMVAICCALSLSAIACKKDSKTTGGSSDAAVDSGGSTPGKDAGGGGGKDAAVDAGGTVTKAECVTMTNTTTMSKVPDTCASCLCAADTATTVACGADCWGLIQCYYANCKDKAGATDQTCATTTPACMPFVAKGGGGALKLAGVVRASCMAECATGATPDGGAADGGGDSGN